MFNLDGKGPLYQQLYLSIRRAIVEQHFQAGEKLPSSRALAKQLSASRNIVISAYEQLAVEGFITSRTGAGSFVTMANIQPPRHQKMKPLSAPVLSDMAVRSQRHWRQLETSKFAPQSADIDFKYGLVEINKAVINDISRITRQRKVQLQSDYQHPAGQRKLREAVSRYLQLNRGCVCHPDRILITNGSQQALDMLARLLLNPGDSVLIEDPGYRGAAQAFSVAGANLIPCAVDEHGINPDTFPVANVSRGPCRLVYATPSHQFPTGAVMPLSRRLKLLEWAMQNHAYIIEDDYDSEFRYRGRPIEAIQGLDEFDRTIYIGTFSKMLSPSLRVGYIILPEQLLEPMLSLKWCTDRFSSSLTQNVLAEFLDSHLFARHLKRMRKLYGERREALIYYLDELLGESVSVQGSNAGIHLLAWLDGVPLVREKDLIDRARSKGVGLYTATALFHQPPERLGLLMGYSRVTPEQIKKGIGILANVIGEFR